MTDPGQRIGFRLGEFPLGEVSINEARILEGWLRQTTRSLAAHALAKTLRAEITAEAPTDIALDADSVSALREVLADTDDLSSEPGLDLLKRNLISAGFEPIDSIDDLAR